MEDNYIGYNDPVRILVSVTYPCIQFTDTGKTSAEFPTGVQKALADMLEQLAKPWKKAKLKWMRDRQAEERRITPRQLNSAR